VPHLLAHDGGGTNVRLTLKDGLQACQLLRCELVRHEGIVFRDIGALSFREYSLFLESVDAVFQWPETVVLSGSGARVSTAHAQRGLREVVGAEADPAGCGTAV
jgi:hypothetical protein